MNLPPPFLIERSFLTRLRKRLSNRGDRRVLQSGPALGAGVIGAGNIATWAYLPELKRGYPFRLVAVCDVDGGKAKSFAESAGGRVCNSVEEILNDPAVNVVFICTPEQYHIDAAILALSAKKHVLCEKPLAANYSDARKGWEAAHASGMTAMVNFSFRFRPEVILLSQIVHSGLIGRIYHIWGAMSQGCWFDEHGKASGQRSDAASWKLDAKGGVIHDLGPHLIDMIRVCFGEFERVQAWSKSFRPETAVSEDACGMSFFMARGCVAHVMTSRWATGFKERTWLEISGSEGAVQFQPGSLRIWTRIEPRWRELLLPDRGDNFLEVFHKAIRGTAQDVPTFWDGMKSNEALEAVVRSAEAGRSIMLPLS